MPHAYNEDQLVEQPAIGLFAELGWQTVVAMEETFGAGGTLGREASGEVVLVSRLHAALTRLNPALPPEAIAAAVDELTRDRSAMSLEAANREVYLLLKEGIKVSVPDKERGGQKTERLRVIDWEHPANNDFLLVSQLSVTGALYTCRPDLVGFVNGLPLVVIELKKPGVPTRVAFDENLTHYKQQIPSLFWFNALLIASNGTDSRVGSLAADWERFFEWKRIERENEPRRVSLEVMIRGTCDRTRLLDMVENFTLFSEHKAGLVKIIGQNHQVLGVNNTIASMLIARTDGHGRGGVFWQTQGSGKSYSMVFFAQKVLRKVPGNWTFVIGTRGTGRPDRQDVQGHRRGERSRGRPVPRRQRRASAGAAARESSLRFHADPQVPNAGNALRPAGRDCPRRRGAPQPIRHAGVEHARGVAQSHFHRLHRHAAHRGRGTDKRRVRRLRFHLRLPAIRRGRRDGAALLRKPHAGVAARQP